MNPTKTDTQTLRDDPRHTFLKPQEVIARFRWGRTRGYLELKKPGFPRPIGGNYPIDTLIAWEDRCLAGDVPQNDAITVKIPLAELLTAQVPSADPVATPTHDRPAELPQRSQSRRRRAALMARPRKDGKPAAPALRIGRERISASGKKWRVRSYAPTDGAPYGRVVCLVPTTGKPTSAVPKLGQTLDELFDQVERALTQNVALGTTVDADGKPDPGRRDIRALSQMYLDDLRSQLLDDDYIANRKSMLNKWIVPMIGSVWVADWSTLHSLSVIKKARAAELSQSRVADIGSTLSGMRMTAWRQRTAKSGANRQHCAQYSTDHWNGL